MKMNSSYNHLALIAFLLGLSAILAFAAFHPLVQALCILCTGIYTYFLYQELRFLFEQYQDRNDD